LTSLIAIACYLIAFNTNRPNYTIIDNSASDTSIHAVASSYKDELNHTNIKLTQEQVNNIVETVKKEEERKKEQYNINLYLLAQVIYSEAGSNWISDEVQLMVANVVMNRVESPYFANTIYDVIYSPNQYQFIKYNISVIPDKRALINAKKILDGFRILPNNVLYQSEYKTLGDGLYKKVQTKYATMYFNYKK